MAIQKQLAFVFLVTLCTESLATREPMKILNTTQQLSHHFPITEVTDHHIATAYFSDDAVSVKTYSLEGQELTSCEAPRVWTNSQIFIGGITSLGNNETLVLHWINTDHHFVVPSIVFVSMINTTNCQFTFKEISISSNSFERGVRIRSFVVPYENSFDVVFENEHGKVVKTRFEANGLIMRNPIEMAEFGPAVLRRIDTVSKYSESKGYLAINRVEEGLIAIAVDHDAKPVKRQNLIQISELDMMKKGFSASVGIDHGKLVFCSHAENTVNCTRYNAATLEIEMSSRIEVPVEEFIGRILILPDGEFWIWAILSIEDDAEELDDMTSSLTKVDVDGRIQESFKISHCVTDIFVIPHLYYANGKICVAYTCESLEPSSIPENEYYSTQSTCY